MPIKDTTVKPVTEIFELPIECLRELVQSARYDQINYPSTVTTEIHRGLLCTVKYIGENFYDITAYDTTILRRGDTLDIDNMTTDCGCYESYAQPECFIN